MLVEPFPRDITAFKTINPKPLARAEIEKPSRALKKNLRKYDVDLKATTTIMTLIHIYLHWKDNT
jgi:hypothetical protein